MRSVFFILLTLPLFSFAGNSEQSDQAALKQRISQYVDTLRVIDTHEHLFTPEIVNGSNFSDHMMLFQQNGYDDLVSASMPKDLFDKLYNESISPQQKWKLIEPYYRNTFNTSYIRIILKGISRLYGIQELNEHTVGPLAEQIKNTYSTDRFDRILRDSCRIDYVIQDGFYMEGKDDYFRYAKKFDNWILAKSTYTIDSIAISQVDPIYSLNDFEKSLSTAFEKAVADGMTVVKVSLAYSRTLSFDKVGKEAALKVFRRLTNGDESFKLSFTEAKPLQDYMLYRLVELAGMHNLPVAFHTGLQAGKGNYLNNSDPLLLTKLFMNFPDVNFVLYHGSYPFGGELSALAKTFSNVYIDMNWMYSISPSYSERYLNEWIETVPVNKIMAFGGDCMAVENVYSELIAARKIISKVLFDKVIQGYITEQEAMTIARMILHDNAANFYNLQ